MIKNNILLLTIIAFVVLIIAAIIMIKPKFDDPQIIFKEAPLEKNSKLKILHEDYYTYNYYMENATVNITYAAIQGENCMIILIAESVNKTNICVDEWGMDELKSNSTFKEPAFILFKPWMLALHENWTWNNSMYIYYDDIPKYITESHYRVVRIDEFDGREAFVVEIETDDVTEYEWVDVERRILLKVEGIGFEVELVDYN